MAEDCPVLIIDDNIDDREVYRRMLSRVAGMNYIVSEAETGDQGIKLAESKRPSCILLDLNMPGLDGRKTLEAIKSNEHWRKIPVVILTTSDDERDIEGCYALGANTYVQKPVDLDGLFAAIQRLKEYWFEIAILPLED